VTNKVVIVANQFYMSDEIMLIKYDNNPESVIYAVKTVEQRDDIDVAKKLGDMIKFENNSIVFEG